MNNIIAAVCCCHRDEHLLDEFIANWQHVAPNIKLVLLSDTRDKVEDARGLKTYKMRWARKGPIAPGVVKALLDVAEKEKAEFVVKLDADVIHNDTSWLKVNDKFSMLGVKAEGKNHALGGCIRYHKDALATLNDYKEWHSHTDFEDQATTEVARKLKCGKIKLLHPKTVCGADETAFTDPEKYPSYAWVHCGQYGKDTFGREKTHRAMITLNGHARPDMVRPTLEPPADALDLRDHFGKVGVVSLDNRPDRYQMFQRRCVLAGVTGVERLRAVHGDACPHPDWWRAGNGAWGCLMSHVRTAQDAIMDGVDDFLVFEDDVVFHKDFVARLPQVKAEADKAGWDMLYLGGQHLYVETAPPWPFREGLVRCNNVNRTHAFAVSKRFAVEYLKHITDFKATLDQWVKPTWNEEKEEWEGEWFPHIDHHLGTIHRKNTTLAVDPWICGQAAGSSNINGRDQKENWWFDKGWGK